MMWSGAVHCARCLARHQPKSFHSESKPKSGAHKKEKEKKENNRENKEIFGMVLCGWPNDLGNGSGVAEVRAAAKAFPLVRGADASAGGKEKGQMRWAAPKQYRFFVVWHLSRHLAAAAAAFQNFW